VDVFGGGGLAPRQYSGCSFACSSVNCPDPLRVSPFERWGLGLGLLVVVIARWPFIKFPAEFELDESAVMAMALQPVAEMIPWVTFEPTTWGPLGAIFLSIFRSIGLPMTYESIHGLALIYLLLALGFTWWSARRMWGRLPAAIAGGMILSWAAVNPHWGLIHMAGELLPMIFLGGALVLVGPNAAGKISSHRWRLMGAALLLGMVPWAKLHAGPVAMGLGLWMVYKALIPPGELRDRGVLLSLVLVGATLPSVVLTSWVGWHDGLSDMWNSYFVGNLSYTGSKASGAWVGYAGKLVTASAVAPWFISAVLLWVFAGWRRPKIWHWLAVNRGGLGICLIWLLTALYCCLKPASPFQHHLLLLLQPLVLTAACSLGAVNFEGLHRRLKVVVSTGLMILIVGWGAARIARDYEQLKWVVTGEDQRSQSQALADVIEHIVPELESLVVWGWEPGIFVSLGMPSSSRFYFNQFLVADWSGRDFQRRRFIEDIESSQPDVIMDFGADGGVILGYQPELTEFPALEVVLAENYQIAATLALGVWPNDQPRNVVVHVRVKE